MGSMSNSGRSRIWNSVGAVDCDETNELSSSGYKRFRTWLAFECYTRYRTQNLDWKDGSISRMASRCCHATEHATLLLIVFPCCSCPDRYPNCLLEKTSLSSMSSISTDNMRLDLPCAHFPWQQCYTREELPWCRGIVNIAVTGLSLARTVLPCATKNYNIITCSMFVVES